MLRIDWNERQIHREDGHLERFAISRYRGEMMVVVIDFSQNCLEAKLRAEITTKNGHIEYIQERTYIGEKEDFIEEMAKRLYLKEEELEGFVLHSRGYGR